MLAKAVRPTSTLVSGPGFAAKSVSFDVIVADFLATIAITATATTTTATTAAAAVTTIAAAATAAAAVTITITTAKPSRTKVWGSKAAKNVA